MPRKRLKPNCEPAVCRFKRYRHTPKGRFTRHKANAKRRGVPFELTFEDWFAIWLHSTYWGVRGYSMNRLGDEGPYAKGNVYIGSVRNNTRDRNFKYGPPGRSRATSVQPESPLELGPL